MRRSRRLRDTLAASQAFSRTLVTQSLHTSGGIQSVQQRQVRADEHGTTSQRTEYLQVYALCIVAKEDRDEREQASQHMLIQTPVSKGVKHAEQTQRARCHRRDTKQARHDNMITRNMA